MSNKITAIVAGPNRQELFDHFAGETPIPLVVEKRVFGSDTTVTVYFIADGIEYTRTDWSYDSSNKPAFSEVKIDVRDWAVEIIYNFVTGTGTIEEKEY